MVWTEIIGNRRVGPPPSSPPPSWRKCLPGGSWESPSLSLRLRSKRVLPSEGRFQNIYSLLHHYENCDFADFNLSKCLKSSLTTLLQCVDLLADLPRGVLTLQLGNCGKLVRICLRICCKQIHLPLIDI